MAASRRSLLLHLVLIVFGVVLPCAFCETGLRVYQLLRQGTPFTTNPRSLWDASLGWLGRERTLGNPSDDPILVIGDSFTEGLGVPTEKMWFAPLARLFPRQGLVAYGGLGYGTFQELLVLQRYLAAGMRPALIVIQLCSNDIINNYYPLEIESYLQRSPGPRPYLVGNHVELRIPRLYSSVLSPLISVSRLAYRTSVRWDTKLLEWAAQGKIESVEFRIQREGFSYLPFHEALVVTDRLLGEVKKTSAQSRLVLMLVDDMEPYTTAFKGIARRYKLPLIVPARDHPIPKSGRMPDGAHLNEDGNKLVGETFVERATALGMFADLGATN